MNKPRSTLVFTKLPYQSSPSFGAFFVSFCFEKNKMLNYGISSVLWAPFAMKTLPKESFPARARQVPRTVAFAGKLLSRKQRDRCWVLGSAQPTFKLVALKEIKVTQACSILEVHRCYAHVR